MDRLAAELDAVGSPAFRLAIAGAGTFPDRGAPRVLWAGLTGDVTALTALAKKVRIGARRAGITLERKPFRPHLTLGRWRPGDAADPAVAAALGGYRGPDFDVTSFALIESHLGPDPRHETLHSWQLDGPEKCATPG